MFQKVAEAKKIFTERQRVQEEEERERRRQEDEKKKQEQDTSEGEKSLRAAIEAWNNRDAATASQLFERAGISFRRAGKLDRVSVDGIIGIVVARLASWKRSLICRLTRDSGQLSCASSPNIAWLCIISDNGSLCHFCFCRWLQ